MSRGTKRKSPAGQRPGMSAKSKLFSHSRMRNTHNLPYKFVAFVDPGAMAGMFKPYNLLVGRAHRIKIRFRQRDRRVEIMLSQK